MVGMYYLWIFW